MGNLWQKQTKQAQASVKKQAASSTNSHLDPAAELQEMIGNQALGRLIESQSHQDRSVADSSPNALQRQISTATNSSIQRQSLFRGLSHELMGNRQGNLVQAKLTVNQPGDKYEQEADRVAEQVVKQINTPSPQSTVSEETMQPQLLMRKAEGQGGGMATSEEFEASLQQERGRGKALDKSIQKPMEQAFGADFTGVRVHTASSSDVLNKAIQAKAFTTGQDMFFRQGVYQPKTQEGQRLIAHELTHVAQQSGTAEVRNKAVIQREETSLVSVTQGKKEKYEETNNKDVSSGRQIIKEKAEFLVGAEIAAKKIVEASEQSRKEAYDLLMRAGFFGSSTTKKETPGSGSSETTMESFVGTEVKGKFSSEVGDVINGIKLLAEISNQTGIGSTVAQKIAFNAGKYSLQLQAKLETFAGFKASAKGELRLNVLDGLFAKGSVEAQAAITGSLTGSAQLSGSNLGVSVEGKGEYLYGASAKASGSVQIGPKAVAASGSAEVFAGAKLTGKGTGSITTRRGGKLINVSVGGSVSAGAGGKVKGALGYEKGKVKLGGGLSGTLGIGGGADLEIEIDIAEIKGSLQKACSPGVAPFSLASKVADKRPNMPEDQESAMKEELYTTFFPRVYNYALKKAKGNSKHYAKRQVVQEIIAEEVQKNDKLAEIIWYKESDEVLINMLYNATSKAANEAGRDQLKASKNNFAIKRGVIILWAYKDKD